MISTARGHITFRCSLHSLDETMSFVENLSLFFPIGGLRRTTGCSSKGEAWAGEGVKPRTLQRNTVGCVDARWIWSIVSVMEMGFSAELPWRTFGTSFFLHAKYGQQHDEDFGLEISEHNLEEEIDLNTLFFPFFKVWKAFSDNNYRRFKIRV